MAKPKTFVFIDFNEDGDFVDADEDVTGDVRSLTVSRFRDFITGYMAGAVLKNPPCRCLFEPCSGYRSSALSACYMRQCFGANDDQTIRFEAEAHLTTNDGQPRFHLLEANAANASVNLVGDQHKVSGGAAGGK